MIFFFTRSDFILYGRPSMIFAEYASPIPGRAESCSLVAVFRSRSSGAFAFSALAAGAALASVLAGAALVVVALVAGFLSWADAPNTIAIAKSASRINVSFFILAP